MTTEIRYAIDKCSLGLILAAWTGQGLCAIFLENSASKLKQELQARFPKTQLIEDNEQSKKYLRKIIQFIENPSLKMDLPLDIQGTAFQQQVWKVLQKIPAGKVMSYTDVAKKIGAPKAFRAVAQACGANKLAILIPCHRVVRQDGSISGYRWGVERKRILLKKEGIAL